METRISIIDSSRLLRNRLSGDLEKRIKNARLLSGLMIGAGILCLLFLLISILTSFLGLPSNLSWEEAALTVIITFSLVLNFQLPFFEARMLKHRQKLKNIGGDAIPEEWNAELSRLLEQIHNRFRFNRLINLLLLLILAAALWQVFSKTAITWWNYFKIPVLLGLAYLLWDFFRVNTRLSGNIKQAEGVLKNSG
jgi:hypothetical protein